MHLCSICKQPVEGADLEYSERTNAQFNHILELVLGIKYVNYEHMECTERVLRGEFTPAQREQFAENSWKLHNEKN